MADFDTLEGSLESSQPIEIYDFSVGSTSYLYTSSEDDIVIGSFTYSAEAIRRGAIIQGSDDRDAVLEITVPSSNVFAKKYAYVVPGQLASLSIIRVQRNEPTPWTQALVYKGYVQSVKFPKNCYEAVIAARSIEASASRPIPRMTYQGMCNHFLYDTGCGVDADSFKHTGEVTDVDGNTITVDGASGQPDGYYVGGFVKPAGLQDFRMVLGHVGDVLTLMLPFPDAILGANADVYAGCDHLIEGHCSTRFNNVGRFGGFAFVPTTNPFQNGIG